jgi:hypothetical protein
MCIRDSIITLPPRDSTPTLALPPTVTFDASAYEGTWNFNLRYDYTGSGYVDTLSYSATLTLNITLDGIIIGSGTFQTLHTDPACSLIRPQTTDGFGFTVIGALAQGADGIGANLTLLPNKPDFIEQYETICRRDPQRGDQAGAFSDALLWRVLEAAGQLELSLSLAQPIYRANPQIDLMALTGGQVAGTLNGEIYFSR